MPEIRLLLGEEDFRKLVAGRIIESDAKVRGTQVWVQIALADIGFPSMTMALRDAIEGFSTHDERPASRIFEGMAGAGAQGDGAQEGQEQGSGGAGSASSAEEGEARHDSASER